MKFILGKKIGMTQIFKQEGEVVPTTVLEAGPVVVTHIKTRDKDGYDAVQFGYGKKKRLTKPLSGHLKNRGSFRRLREYAMRGGVKDVKVGDSLDISIFEEGDRVTIRALSKGKGFQGVVKRHGFAGFPKSHGTKKHHRAGGSIGSQFPQHVMKGKRMAGRMGQDRVTTRGVEIVKVDKENGLIALRGAVPGARGSLVEIRG